MQRSAMSTSNAAVAAAAWWQSGWKRAMRLFPEWPTDPVHAAAIVAEECGELQKAVLEAVYEPHKMSRNNVPIEAVQTAAMCIRFLACIDRYSWLEPEERA